MRHKLARRSRVFRRSPAPGLPAGTLRADPAASAPLINVMAYSTARLVEYAGITVPEVATLRTQFPILWVDVEGLGDVATLRALGEVFGLHALALEDVINRRQRAKFERYEGYQFAVLTMLWQQGTLHSEQLSLFWGAGFVLSLQEGHPGDSLTHPRRQLRDPHSLLRHRGTDYLFYALLDSVVDHYFPMLEALGDQLETLEDTIEARPSVAILRQLHACKHDLRLVRHAVWPLRELFSVLEREAQDLLHAETRLYLRDCHDHVLTLLDMTESYRDVSADLGEFYLSRVNHRMNAIIKVMTIVTTIFVPLTFVAGIYGMNFNPERSPWNMPELDAYWGYPLVLLLMLAIALGLTGWFWWRGWIGDEEHGLAAGRRGG